MVDIALVGFGYWGPNLLRNFLVTQGCRVRSICDIDKKKHKQIQKTFPGIQVTDSFQDILVNTAIDSVVIATPPSTHFLLASQAIHAGKDVLVEKPITVHTKDARKLVDLAKKKKKILMVDHTFVYTKPVELIKKIIDSGKLGQIVNIDSVRVNLGLYQNDINVIEDIAIHDLSIFDYFFAKPPKSVSVIGSRYFDSRQEDQAYLHLWYPNNILAHVNVSWFSPIKVRRMIISGTRQMLVYDEMELTEKIKIFDIGIKIERDPDEILKMKVGYRRGNIFSPNLEIKEALLSVAEDFVHSVKTRTIPRCDGDAGLRVLKILDGAMMSLKNKGMPVTIL